MQTRRRGGWRAALAVAAGLFYFAGCGEVRKGPQDSSATHFLKACAGTCGGGLECVCGVCTKACGGDDTCVSVSSAATCTTPADQDGLACSATQSSVCDVECTTSSQCSSLGVGFTCVSGRCRLGATDGGAPVGPQPDSGGVFPDATPPLADAAPPLADAALPIPDAGVVIGDAASGADSSSTTPEGGVDAGTKIPDAAPSGPLVFARRLDTEGGNTQALAVDPTDGSSYVLTNPNGPLDLGNGPVGGAFLIKLTDTGEVAWYRAWPQGLQGSLAADGNGNVVITAMYSGLIDLGAGPIGGGSQSTQPSDTGVFVAMYSRTGQLVFGKAWKGTRLNLPRSAAFTPNGDILVGGVAQGIDFGSGIWGDGVIQAGFVLRLKPDGTLAWSRKGTNGIVYHVVSDASGGAILVGWGYGQVDFGGTPVASHGGTNDFLVARLSPAGVQTEVSLFGTNTGQEANVTGAAADADGNVTFTGTVDAPFVVGSGPTLSSGSFVASVAPGGAHRYSFSLQGSGYFAGVAMDAAGRAWVTGAYDGPFALGGLQAPGAEGRSVVLFRIEKNGTVDWLHGYGGNQATDSSAFVAVDGAGRPTIAPTFGNGVNFGAGDIATSSSLVVARLNP